MCHTREVVSVLDTVLLHLLQKETVTTFLHLHPENPNPEARPHPGPIRRRLPPSPPFLLYLRQCAVWNSLSEDLRGGTAAIVGRLYSQSSGCAALRSVAPTFGWAPAAFSLPESCCCSPPPSSSRGSATLLQCGRKMWIRRTKKTPTWTQADVTNVRCCTDNKTSAASEHGCDCDSTQQNQLRWFHCTEKQWQLFHLTCQIIFCAYFRIELT